MSPNVPIGSLQGIEALIALGLQVFAAVFSLFHQQQLPVAAAPALIAHMQATPGLSAEHQAVVANAVNQAVAAHQAS